MPMLTNAAHCFSGQTLGGVAANVEDVDLKLKLESFRDVGQ